MDALEGLLNFIHTDNFKRTLQTKNYQITTEMLDFMLNYDPYRNRLANFLAGIDLNKLEEKKLSDVRQLGVKGWFDKTTDVKNIQEFFFYSIINMIDEEIVFITQPQKADKKFYDDIKRLNKLQQQIIERYYFKDDVLSYFKKIGAEYPFIKFKGRDDVVIKFFLCYLMRVILELGYCSSSRNQLIAIAFANTLFMKEYDKLPTLNELTKCTLNIKSVRQLIPLLYGFADTLVTVDKKKIQETFTSDALEAINDYFSLGIKYEIGRNEFQNAVKKIYQAYTKHHGQ